MKDQKFIRIIDILSLCFISIYPALFLYVNNNFAIALPKLTTAICLSILFTTIFFLFFFLITHSNVKSTIILFVLILSFYSYGHFFFLLKHLFEKGLLSSIVHHRLTLTFYLLINLLLLVFFAYTRKDKFVSKLAQFVPILSMGLFLMLLAFVIRMILSPNKLKFENDTLLSQKNVLAENSLKSSKKPDIYYFTIDEFAPPRVINRLFDKDASWLDSFFISRSFKVNNMAVSNYHKTTFSLSSSLNMDYIHTNTMLLDSSRVGHILHKHGYKEIYRLKSGSLRDYFIDLLVNDFNEVLFNRSLIMVIYPYLQYFNVKEIFKRIPRLLDEEGPKFVHFHFPVPHEPFIFDSLGRMNSLMNLSNWDDKSQYYGQWKFVAQQVMKLTDSILAKTDGNSIIIFQSDHGVRGLNSNPLTYYQMCFNIFFTAYLPHSDNNCLFKGRLTPVNIFRILLTNYFSYKYLEIPDRCFYSNYKDAVFLDITDSVEIKDR